MRGAGGGDRRDPAQDGVEHAEVVEGLGEVRGGLEGALVVLDGAVEVAVHLLNHAHVVQGHGVAGVELHGKAGRVRRRRGRGLRRR